MTTSRKIMIKESRAKREIGTAIEGSDGSLFFFCAACGRKTQIRSKLYDKPYTGKDNCLHPELKKIPDRICAGCYDWDYDAHKRMRKFWRNLCS